MWEVDTVDGLSRGDRYIIRCKANGGYLSLNGPGGGALHFEVASEAEAVRDLLNSCQVR